MIAVPLLRGGQAIGAVGVSRREAGGFPDDEVELLRTFADQAVIAIENARLFTEIERRNRELTEALERETATGEVLRVISSSPTHIQPVLDPVARSAARLCEAVDSVIFLEADGKLFARARHGRAGRAPGPTRPPSPGSVVGRTFLERRTFHVHDLLEATAEFPDAVGRAVGDRTVLGVPLLREGRAIGVVLIQRAEVRPFSDRHVALLQTFADQAVIAIENVRLFTELRENLEEQTATAEILRIISSSPTELRPVLRAIADSAAQVCDSADAAVLLAEGAEMVLAGTHHRPVSARTRFPLDRAAFHGYRFSRPRTQPGGLRSAENGSGA